MHTKKKKLNCQKIRADKIKKIQAFIDLEYRMK